MLRSEFCILDKLDDPGLYELNECPFDQVRSTHTHHGWLPS
jgi:hypothetical protein